MLYDDDDDDYDDYDYADDTVTVVVSSVVAGIGLFMIILMFQFIR